MKQPKRFLPRLLSMALALMLALTTVAPVLAANTGANTDNLKITIHNNTGLPEMRNDQFGVYQLFTGTPKRDGDAVSPEWDATNWNNYILADIKWGASITDDGVALLAALKAIDASTTDWIEGSDNPFASVNSAAALADVLVGKDNHFMQGFADFLMTGKDVGNSFLEDLTLTGEIGADADGQQTLSYDLQSYGTGYYIFQDKNDPKDSDIVSEYIVAVMGSQDIDLKASVPTVQKWINAVGDKKGTTADIGEAVKFVLQGTLPKNIGDFDSYKYVFHDTLATGLTFKEATAGLTVKVGETALTNPDQYQIVTSGTGDACNLHIVIPNLKAAGFPDITADTKITVEYNAALNESAVIGHGVADNPGNPNTVKLQYSNDPHDLDTTAETEVDTVRVYTFGLDLKKVGVDTDSTGLKDASFTLQNKTTNAYAKFTDGTDGKKVFAGWEEEGKVKTLLDAYTKAKKAWDEAQPNAQPESGDVYDAYVSARDALLPYILTSGADGSLPDAVGLDADTYTLKEVITPAGYNTMADEDVTITAVIPTDPKSADLTSFTYSGVDNNGTYSSTSNPTIYENGLIPDTLTNTKGPVLPFTGGMGTLVFYLLGGMMIVGAIVYLTVATKKRKQAE